MFDSNDFSKINESDGPAAELLTIRTNAVSNINSIVRVREQSNCTKHVEAKYLVPSKDQNNKYIHTGIIIYLFFHK